jgi:hypothetical protein
MPATVETLRTYLGLAGASGTDDEAMQLAVDAANDYVRTLRPDLTTDDLSWPSRAEQAALVQSARLYGRRGSVQGVAAFADIGVSLLPRLDPEVRSLLELGEYQPSVVA